MSAFITYKPAAPLDAFVDSIWFCELSEPLPHAQERLLPTGTVQLIINLKEDATRTYDRRDNVKFTTMPGSVVTGTHTEFFVIDTSEQELVMGVHFKPGGAFPFLGLPAGELLNLHVALDDLWGHSAVSELREKLLAAANVQEKFRIVEQHLLRIIYRPLKSSFMKMHSNGTGNRAVEYALNNFLAAPGSQRITDVTEKIGISQRRFIELFKRKVGTSPKSFCRVMRFQQVVRSIAAADDRAQIDWIDLALDSGYFDQAHFVHDFRHFAGMTPTEYAAKVKPHQNHVPI